MANSAYQSESPRSPVLAPLPWPEPIVTRWTKPFAQFLQVESASGIVLLSCAILAVMLANSPLADTVNDFWQTRGGVVLGPLELNKTLLLLINDGLMTLFFFAVGLEIKRELVTGELRDPRKAALPALAALGGMIVPALCYSWFMRGQPGVAGWSIPMATDIAFVVGGLTLFGSRAPLGLKIILLSLAIVDDLGVILVIAVFYTANLSAVALGMAILGLGFVLLLQRLGVRAVGAYVVLGIGIWLALLKSGIHPTIAGVALGLLTPARPLVSVPILTRWLEEIHRPNDPWLVDTDSTTSNEARLQRLELVSREGQAPLNRLESRLHPVVAFVIMPIFALANAGVPIDSSALVHPVSCAVAIALFVGKPAGIMLFSWLAVRGGWARLPDGVSWTILFGGSCLAGIGFTMSLFMAGLALDRELLAAGKIGTLIGSICSMALGYVILRSTLPRTGLANRSESFDF